MSFHVCLSNRREQVELRRVGAARQPVSGQSRLVRPMHVHFQEGPEKLRPIVYYLSNNVRALDFDQTA